MKNLIAYSHIGNSRENQEDNYFIGRGKYLFPEERDSMKKDRRCKIQSIQDEKILCCVSDGMGGHKFGEVASYLTVKYIDENYDRIIENCSRSYEYANQFVKDLNEYVCEKAVQNSKFSDMGATLCGVFLKEDSGICFNVGDSRAYRVFKDRIEQITIDNTQGTRLFNLGLLNRKEVEEFPKKKAIYKYIGQNSYLVPDLYEISDLKNGEFILICSDGLSDVILEDEIFEIMSKKFISTRDKGKFLVEMAVEKNTDAGDNITLIIIEK